MLLPAIVIVSLVRLAETRLVRRARVRSPMARLAARASSPSYVATLLLIGCVALVFYFIPNTKVRFRDVWPGAILVGVLWRGALSAVLLVRRATWRRGT